MASELFSEMFMEIMSRSTLKSRDTMCCVSKVFNTLANESYVVDQLKKNNKMVSGYLIQNVRRCLMHIEEFTPSPGSSSLDLAFLPYDARILATSEQGIMVFQTHDPMEFNKEFYHVCKPTTKQVLALPNPKRNEMVGRFAIVVMGSKPLRYKIIRVSDRPELRRSWGKLNTLYGCDIFDSLTWEWQSQKHIKLAGHCVSLTDSLPITVSGSIYMLLSIHDILKFDAYSEKWKVFSSPIPYDESAYSNPPIMLVKYDGRLGLVCKSTNADGCWDIWVMKTDGVWEKEDVAVKSESERESLKALYDSGTSVMVQCHTLVLQVQTRQQDGQKGRVEGHPLSNVLLPIRFRAS
ncbi:uncharacterized protein LOC143549865 [Bidens hawaiensis]|uniref:uncharacterized protein LOC143549865 n=1 Tax=Bidens hawaiensis TaxID=980011 RepID=UPI00404977B9